MASDEHCAHCDSVADDGLHQLRRRRRRVAIAEDDDVLEAGIRFFQRPVRQAHNVLKTAKIALIHAGDGTAHGLLVADLFKRK